MTNTDFAFLTASQKVTFEFDDNVSSVLSIDDFVLHHQSTNTNIDREDLSLSYNAGTDVASITFPGLSNSGISGIPADGNYEVVLTDTGVPGLDADYVHPFFLLIADADRDRAVSSSDFGILSTNFNTAGTWEDGDFNLDGTVDIDDYDLLAANYNRQIAEPLTGANEASTSALSSSSIRVEWTEPDNGTPDGYRVFRSEDSINFTQIAEVGDTTFVYDDTGRTDGTKYWYRVRPYTTAEGNGATTNKDSSVTVMSVPTDLAAAALSDDESTAVFVSWTNVSGSSAGITIQRATNSTFTSNLVTFEASADDGNFRDVSAEASTTYYYRIRAVNEWTTSAYTSSVSVVGPTALPGGATGFVALAQSDTEVDLSWDDSGNETGYRLERSTDQWFESSVTSLGMLSANTTTYSDTVSSAGTYWYRLTPYNSVGDAWRPSAAGVDTTESTPADPDNVYFIEKGEDGNQIYWSDLSDDESGFIIERATNSGFTANLTEVAVTKPGVTTFLDDTADSQTQYYYRVISVQATRESNPAIGELILPIEDPDDTTDAIFTEVLEQQTGLWQVVPYGSGTTTISTWNKGFPVHVRLGATTLEALGHATPRYTWKFKNPDNSIDTMEGFNAAWVIPSNAGSTQEIKLTVDFPGTGNGALRSYTQTINLTLATPSLTTVRIHNGDGATLIGGEVTWATFKANNFSMLTSHMIVEFEQGGNHSLVGTFVSGGGTPGSDTDNDVVESIRIRGKSNIIFKSVTPNSGSMNAAPIIQHTYPNTHLGTRRLTTTEANTQGRTGTKDQNRFIFDNSDATKNIVVDGLEFSSPFDAAYSPNGQSGIVSSSAAAPDVIRQAGTNVAIVNSRFGLLRSVVETPFDSSVPAIGWLFENNATLSTTAITNYYMFMVNANAIVATGNTFVDSRHESVFRFNRDDQYINLHNNPLLRFKKDDTEKFVARLDLNNTETPLDDDYEYVTTQARESKAPFRLVAGPTGAGAYMYASGNFAQGGFCWFGPEPDLATGSTTVLPNERNRFSVLSGNTFDTRIRLNPGLQDSMIRNNRFLAHNSFNEGAMWVKAEISSTLYPATKTIERITIAHNTLDLRSPNPSQASVQRNALLLYRRDGRAETVARLRSIRIVNNLITAPIDPLPAQKVPLPAGVYLESLASGAPQNWLTTINATSTRWLVAGNVYAPDVPGRVEKQFRLDGPAPGNSVQETLNLSEFLSAINVTDGTNTQLPVTLDSAFRPAPPSSGSLERLGRQSDAWFDFNGDLRLVDSNSKVTVGAFRRTFS